MNQRSNIRLGAVVAGLAFFSQSAWSQSDFQWTGLAGSGNWNLDNNWINLTAGGIVSGFPSLADSAQFVSDASVFNGQVLDVLVDPSVAITLGSGGLSSTTLAGMFTNNGTVSFIADSSNNDSSRVDQRLFIASGTNATLDGNGLLVFNGHETGIQGAGILLSSLTNGVGHTIIGPGTLLAIELINTGTITPSFGTTNIYDTAVHGSGRFDVEDDGTLLLGAGADVYSTTISGAPGAVLYGDSTGTMRDVELEGTLTIGSGGLSSITISGMLTNSGVLTFNADSSNNDSSRVDQRLFVASGTNATFSGGGFVVLNGLETGFQGAGVLVSSLTNAAGHTLTGPGSFSSIEVVNDGTISPSFGTTNLFDTAVRGSGQIAVNGDGALFLGAGADVHDTTISGSPGAVLFGDSTGKMRNLGLQGNLTIGSGGLSSISISGSIINTGTMTFNADASNNDSSRVDQRLFISSGTTATLGGNGSLVLKGAETGIQGSGPLPTSFTNDTAHTIDGFGTFQDIDVINRGTITPSAGIMGLYGTELEGTGSVDIADTGTLLLAAGADVHDTTINGSSGAVLIGADGGKMRDVQLGGTMTLGSGGLSTTSISGTITNNAVLTFNADSSNNDSSRVDQRLFISSGTNALLGGTGSLVLNGIETGIQGSGPLPALFTNDTGHTIAGNGTFQSIDVINRGIINPGGSGRAITFASSNSVGLTSMSELVFDLGGQTSAHLIE